MKENFSHIPNHILLLLFVLVISRLPATIIGLEDSKATAEPKINPLASIDIIASAFFKNGLADILKSFPEKYLILENLENILKSIPFLENLICSN